VKREGSPAAVVRQGAAHAEPPKLTSAWLAAIAGSKDLLQINQSILHMEDDRFARASRALARYERRQARTEEPAGGLDRQGRWQPAPTERSVVVERARMPNRAFAYAFRMVCRSLEHCEALEGADRGATVLVRYWVKALERLTGERMPDPNAYRMALQLEQTVQVVSSNGPDSKPRRPRL